MKYFSAIVAAFLCAAVVSAAPSTPNPTFEELALNPFNTIGDKVKEFMNTLKCYLNVINEEVSKSGYPEWQKKEAEFHKMVTEEWGKCLKVVDTIDQVKCKLNVLRMAYAFIDEFTQEIRAKNKELFERIRERVMQCSAHTFAASLPEQFECFIEALRKVSNDNGLGDMWSKTEPLFKSHLESWKQCANAGSKFAKIFCNIQQGITTLTIMTDYIREMAAANPKTVQDFMRAIQMYCQTSEEAELAVMFDSLDSKDPREKFRCIVEAIGEAVKETDFAGIFEKMRKDLDDVRDRLAKCRNEQSNEDKVKCARKELMRGREIVMAFLNKMRDASRDTLQRVRDLVKQRCFS